MSNEQPKWTEIEHLPEWDVANMDNYVWKNIKSLEELESTRMSAMRKFLSDYEKGKAEGRYVFHELPDKLPYG